MKIEFLPHKTNDISLRSIIREVINNEIISEGLIESYPPEIIFNYFNQLNLKKDVDYDIIDDFDRKAIILITRKNNKIKEQYNNILNKLQNTFGWIHGSTELLGNVNRMLKNKKDFIDDINENNQYILFFESKFDIPYEGNNLLYHVTFEFNLNKILKFGLKPKLSNKEFSYGDQHRIYLFKEFDINNIKSLTKHIYDIYGKKNENNNRDGRNYRKFVLLEVKNEDLRLYNDINYINGVYTNENIHPSNITPTYKLEIDVNNKINVFKI